MEELNVVDATQEPVVEVQDPAVETSESEVTEPVASEDVAKPQQTAEENAKFAEFRRKAELAESEAVRIKQENDYLLNALRGYGYEGSPQEIADNLLAQQTGISPEEAKQQREADEAVRMKQSQTEHELEFYRTKAIEDMKSRDFQAIKTAYPDVKASRIEELGENFINIFNTGQVSALEAYEAARVIDNRSKKPVPPALGGVNTTNSTEKDFYTPAEVDRLTDNDYDKNPKLWETVRKSMLKWK